MCTLRKKVSGSEGSVQKPQRMKMQLNLLKSTLSRACVNTSSHVWRTNLIKKNIRYVGWIVCRWSKRTADSTRLSDLLNFYIMNMNIMKVLPKSNIWERWIINEIYLISQLLLLKCSEIKRRAYWHVCSSLLFLRHFFYEKELNDVSSKESQTVLRFVNILKSAIKNQMNSNILHLLSQIISTMPSTSTWP